MGKEKGKVFRASTLKEREEFYEEEFDLRRVIKWFKERGMKLPQLCAVDAGSETGIIVDKKLKGIMLYFPFEEFREKIKKYVPEDIYYDRNIYANPGEVLDTLNFNNPISQELTFDIDADNLGCDCEGKRTCDSCIDLAFEWAKKMKKELEREFKQVEIIYSGRGFHLHVFDKKAFLLNAVERRLLNKKFSKFPIDEWVSAGNIRLIRLPYSLNGLVSRKVIPIKDLKFEKEKSYPGFL